jgi:hypothetical protein
VGKRGEVPVGGGPPAIDRHRAGESNGVILDLRSLLRSTQGKPCVRRQASTPVAKTWRPKKRTRRCPRTEQRRAGNLRQVGFTATTSCQRAKPASSRPDLTPSVLTPRLLDAPAALTSGGVSWAHVTWPGHLSSKLSSTHILLARQRGVC